MSSKTTSKSTATFVQAMMTVANTASGAWITPVVTIPNGNKITITGNAGGTWTSDGCGPDLGDTWIGDPIQPYDQMQPMVQPMIPPCGTGTNLPYPQGWGTVGQQIFQPIIAKGIGKPDLLGDFFGPGVDAIVIVGEDKGATFVPFMNKFGMIWLQGSGNSWSAYDKKKFMDFIDDEDQQWFNEPALSKDEVVKRMSAPEENGGPKED